MNVCAGNVLCCSNIFQLKFIRQIFIVINSTENPCEISFCNPNPFFAICAEYKVLLRRILNYFFFSIYSNRKSMPVSLIFKNRFTYELRNYMRIRLIGNSILTKIT